MKRINLSNTYLIVFIFILLGLMISLEAKNLNEKSSRIQFTINEQWKFSLDGDENFILKNFEDSNWDIVNLPHSWNKDDAFDESKTYYRGSGFYRKKIFLNPEWRNKKIFLFFEGANQVTDVYINRNFIGQHKGGYTAFTFDITSSIDFENENLLSIRVDNTHDISIPPLNADFTFYGGIYRDVWLIVTDSIHIDLLDYSSSGVFIDTPEISVDKAKLRVRGTIVNEKEETTEVKIINRIFDKDNAEVTVLKSSIVIKGKSKKKFELTGEIENPNLWSTADPYLYKINTEIYEKKNLIDEIIKPVGLRWFNFNSDSGFYLNGKSLKLLGTNRHQDYKGYGNALPDQLHENDIKIIKENGFNFLRLAHYPQDPAILKAADKYGLIVWEEIPIVNLITISESFTENCKTMLREMIRQHYNHPSILMWGYMNEVMLRKPEVIPDGYYEAIVSLAKELEQIVKTEDEFRATVMALSFDELKNKTDIGMITDIIGMNLYFGWYYETIKTFGKYMDDYHKRNPDRPVIISEYGAGSDERIHSFHPKAFDFSTEYQQIFHEQTFPQILERDYILGCAVWNQFDFGSYHRQDTKPLINQKGLYYYNRKPKDISYYYKAKLSNEPVIHIAVNDWKFRSGYNSETNSQPLKVYTNLKKISIDINNKYIGNYIPDNCIILLQVPLNEGANKIQVKGDFKDESLEEIEEIFYQDLKSFSNQEEGKNISVNLGADYEYIDKNESVWVPGSNIENIKMEITGGASVKTHHKILNTDDEPVFQSAVEGIGSLNFIIPDGSYEVQLYLAEIQNNNAEERVYNIFVNDIPVFINLDLIKSYGGYNSIIKKMNIFSKNKEGIEIKFEAIKGNTLLNGVKIRSIL